MTPKTRDLGLYRKDREKAQLGVERCFSRAQRSITWVRADVFKYHGLAGLGNVADNTLAAL